MMPDIRVTPEAILTEGDRVVCEWSYRATYYGRPVELRECAVSRLDGNGRVAEMRVHSDRLSLLRELGLPVES